ncbi:MAG: hypothetical protein TREMPRED_003500 [Tremellales sp. Tagirdzhanova-0007]|nr:MAG: hypothetical protein TREMPRED_003500 [Tremellales sp. Tagirdzhanova-0007]
MSDFDVKHTHFDGPAIGGPSAKDYRNSKQHWEDWAVLLGGPLNTEVYLTPDPGWHEFSSCSKSSATGPARTSLIKEAETVLSRVTVYLDLDAPETLNYMIFNRIADLLFLSSIYMEDVEKTRALDNQLAGIRYETARNGTPSDTRNKLLSAHRDASQLTGDVSRYRLFAEESPSCSEKVPSQEVSEASTRSLGPKGQVEEDSESCKDAEEGWDLVAKEEEP